MRDLDLYKRIGDLEERARQQVRYNKEVWAIAVKLSQIIYNYDLHEADCLRFDDKDAECTCVMRPVKEPSDG